MKVVKQRFSRLVHGKGKPASEAQATLWSFPRNRIWQKRFYDFNVWSTRKRIEKLRYIHRNPVKRGLVALPDQWKWSSFRYYAYGEEGPVKTHCQEWKLEIEYGAATVMGDNETHPLIRKKRE